jgi:hypothetical protein
LEEQKSEDTYTKPDEKRKQSYGRPWNEENRRRKKVSEKRGK